ncbi:ADP-ribosyltransferase exoenzyme [Novipirellula galeiformis]|uniref:ADP-ribosyltransferase exoenzyme n=1 Tax=Novipirellula galeiformis TaxID=2528004 RepID=A0A5C6CDV9_9BACT|nr:ADP-ribosyltransferase [Novipirellula galeiformis]TWU22448.1 ADP-ribosyltransferase exoenzyme [Novipirellula galeiformis]
MINLFNRRRKPEVDTKPKTGKYEPVSYGFFNQQRDLPLFTFDVIRTMLLDGQVRLSLAMRAAPVSGVEWAYKEGKNWIPGIESDSPEVSKFILRQLERIWTNHLSGILSAQVWGWSAGEITMRLSGEGLVEIDRLEPRQAVDCRLIQSDSQPWGVRVDRVADVGSVDLPFPYAWFHAHAPEPGETYGQSALLGAYSPWADKCHPGGAVDVRRLFMHKDAYGGTDLGYPEGSDFYDDQGNPIPNRDIARQIIEQLQAGAVTTRPSTRDELGNEKWPLTRATVPANPQHILQYPKDLDSEIRGGIGIPDDVIDSDGSGGGWAGKRIPMGAFCASLDDWVDSITSDLREQCFDRLVMLNWGRAIDYEIKHKPLAEQMMEQQSNAGPGEDGQPQQGGGQEQSPQRFGLDTVDAVGRGVLDASRIVDAARSVLRMGADADKSKGFWRSGDDGQKVFIGPDGKARAGGPDGKELGIGSGKGGATKKSGNTQKMDKAGERTKQQPKPREKAQAKPEAKPLTKQEADAVTAYSTRKFQEINGDLRSGKGTRNKATIQKLDSAIAKSKTTTDQQLFRAAKIPAIDEALKSGNIEGLEFSDHAYTSTSKDKSRADNFARDGARMFKVNVPKGSSAIDVGDHAGGLKGEQEVLLPRGSKFRVKGVQKVKEKVAYRDARGKVKHRMKTVEYVEIDLINEGGEDE